MVKTFVYRGSLDLENKKYGWLSKSAEIGDYVEQDDEIATIETDKV